MVECLDCPQCRPAGYHYLRHWHMRRPPVLHYEFGRNWYLWYICCQTRQNTCMIRACPCYGRCFLATCRWCNSSIQGLRNFIRNSMTLYCIDSYLLPWFQRPQAYSIRPCGKIHVPMTSCLIRGLCLFFRPKCVIRACPCHGRCVVPFRRWWSNFILNTMTLFV